MARDDVVLAAAVAIAAAIALAVRVLTGSDAALWTVLGLVSTFLVLRLAGPLRPGR